MTPSPERPAGSSSGPRTGGSSQTEPRSVPRYIFIAVAEVSEEGSGAQLSVRTSDISLKGCYIDTLNPFPPDTQIRVRLHKEDEVFESRARVCFSHPGMGMGVIFIDLAPEQQARLMRWIGELGG